LHTQEQSSDQEFEAANKALLMSCLRGLPVRVVRSYKEKRSNYAPSEDCPVSWCCKGGGRERKGKAVPSV
jgi:E3 ubiquitin-protein ligase UHRF1